MYGYIYETTNLVNGKKYIGKHKNNIFDKKYYGSGVGLNLAIKKYGKENFKVRIIEKINTNQKELDLREMYWINKFDAVKSKEYYNRSYGGENEGWEGVNKAIRQNGILEEIKEKRIKAQKEAYKKRDKPRKLSIETINKIQKSRKKTMANRENPFLGKHHTKEAKKIMSEKHKGNTPWNKGKKGIYTEETINKMREKAIGRKHSAKSRGKMSETRKGHKVSEKTREKIKKANSGRKYINKNEINKIVKKEDIEKYLSEGWKLGKFIKNT